MSRRETAALVGAGAIACAACCAGPILGFLAAIGLGTAFGWFVYGAVGAALAVVAGAFLLLGRHRRARSAGCSPTAGATTVVVSPPKGRTAVRS